MNFRPYSSPLFQIDLEEYKMLYGDGYASGENFTGIISKLKDDTDFRERYSEEAHKLAKKFSFEILGPRLIDIYQKLLG